MMASSAVSSPSGLVRPPETGEMTSARLAPRKVSVSRPAPSAARKTSEATKPRVRPTAASRASSSSMRAGPASGTWPASRGRHRTASPIPSPTRMGAGALGPPKAGTIQAMGTVRAAPSPTAATEVSSSIIAVTGSRGWPAATPA